jgi:hypothetical protein
MELLLATGQSKIDRSRALVANYLLQRSIGRSTTRAIRLAGSSRVPRSRLVNPGDDALTLTEKTNAAFRQAAISVIERARQTGTPIIVWENGKVVERSPEDFDELLEQ